MQKLRSISNLVQILVQSVQEDGNLHLLEVHLDIGEDGVVKVRLIVASAIVVGIVQVGELEWNELVNFLRKLSVRICFLEKEETG